MGAFCPPNFITMGLIDGIFGIGLGIANNRAADRRQDKAIAAQTAENQKQRDYEKQMAEWTNEQRIQEANREREYNSPAAVMGRLAAAGLNPDMAMSSGGSSYANASAPEMVSPNAVPPADVSSAIMGTPLMGESLLQGISAMKGLAETEKIKVDTKKSQGEITTIDLDNVRKAATNGSMIELDNMQVSIAKQAMSLTDTQITNLTQQTNNLKTANDQMNQSIRESISRAKNIDSATLRNNIETSLLQPRFRNECLKLAQDVKESDARINFTQKQAECLVISTLAQKLNLEADAMYKKVGASKMDVERANAVLQGDIIRLNGLQLELNYKSDTNFKDWERACDITTKVFNCAGNVINALVPF